MAKSFDNLYPTITSFQNLWQAYRKAAKGKRGQQGVAEFEYRLESNLLIQLLSEFRIQKTEFARDTATRKPTLRLSGMQAAAVAVCMIL